MRTMKVFPSVILFSTIHREAFLHDPTPARRWLLEEFALAHIHSKNRNGKYLVALMLDEIKASEIDDTNLKNYVETNTYINCKDLVSQIVFHVFHAGSKH